MTFRRCALILLASAPLLAQPAFDAAVFKINKSQEPESGNIDHGRIAVHNAPMTHLVAAAYNVRVDLVKGGPSWVDSDRFDIVAKADPEASEDTARLMLRTLLAERCKLVVHQQPILTAVYFLKAGKDAGKLHPTAPDSPDKPGCTFGNPITCHQRTMADLADALRRSAFEIDLPVVDQTGLAGAYDFTVKYGRGPKGPSIFDAVEQQLGLKLEHGKHTIEFTVIDSVERVPVEN